VTTDSENPFWDFSLAVYGRPGVAEACLALQDRHGLDVNLLLLCCWAGSQGQRLDRPDMARLMASVGDWQRCVVGPLRSVRRRLKHLPDGGSGQLGALRQAVRDCELDAERIEQIMLRDALAPTAEKSIAATGQADCAAANLAVYLEMADTPTEPGDRADLKTVLRGAFGTLRPEMAERWFPQ
jgi:uncharacterized protein (TIGR02444 family)